MNSKRDAEGVLSIPDAVGGLSPPDSVSTQSGSPQRHPIRTLGWLYSWARRIVLRHDLELDRFRGTAWTLRFSTHLLSLTGLTIGLALTSHEVRKATFTPVPVHCLIFLSISTFLSVGFWMLCNKDRGTQRLGWLFLSASFIGSAIYAASSYAYLALDETGWPGGSIAGWIGDILFLPAIALLLPPFLTLIPTGRKHSTIWRGWTLGLAGISATLLSVSLVFEQHLFTHAMTPAPLAQTAFAKHWAWPIGTVGVLLLGIAVCSGFFAAWARAIHSATSESEWNRLKWYVYGGLIGVAALLPYLMVVVAPDHFFPSAPSWAKAWGATAVVALAVAAVPSTLGEPWHSGRIKRLSWGVLIAAVATAAHEFGVVSVAEHVQRNPQEELHLGTQLAVTYALSLGVALAFEPVAEWFHDRMIHYRNRRGSPDVLLDEALEDMRSSVKSMNEAAERADSGKRRLIQFMRRWWPRVNEDDDQRSRRLTRGRALQRELASTIDLIGREAEQATRLVARLGERLARLDVNAEEGAPALPVDKEHVSGGMDR